MFEEQTRRIRADREALAALPGLRVWPGQANFLLLRAPPGRARALFEGLRRRGILAKSLDGSHPLLAECLRITVGAPEENRALLDALGVLPG